MLLGAQRTNEVLAEGASFALGFDVFHGSEVSKGCPGVLGALWFLRTS